MVLVGARLWEAGPREGLGQHPKSGEAKRGLRVRGLLPQLSLGLGALALSCPSDHHPRW